MSRNISGSFVTLAAIRGGASPGAPPHEDALRQRIVAAGRKL